MRRVFENFPFFFLFKFLIFPSLLALVFLYYYTHQIRAIPVSYWDEFEWVGRSCFFQLFVQKDVNNSSWQSVFAYEQSKLGEYLYGAWLYPLYLQERKTREDGYDYVKFLIDHGFYRLDGSDGEKYLNYITYKSNHLIRIVDTIAQDFFSGYPQDFVYSYGVDVLKPLTLIYHARIINAVLLLFSIVILYFLMIIFLRFHHGIVASLLYGCNSLIIFSSLPVYAEALFLFTFNLGVFFMYLYLTQNHFKILYFLFFSISAGLCMSTKLNGILLILCFFIVNIIYLLTVKEMNHIVNHALIGFFFCYKFKCFYNYESFHMVKYYT